MSNRRTVAMDVNDYAGYLIARVVWASIASMLPTGEPAPRQYRCG
ncbi:hypothetical protein SAMN04490206_3820 [Pseudomonas umsongensis]|nr:hypothetical protein SAMN04490206_3820 [Pseudomonas umsongensis]